ncbi:transcription factor steA-like [Homarus americanus]|uniref:Transcription factor steA-like n=1 Tax=Homarus americanus TaxID=6706 RepID=A0A8J5JUI3_HOMAM|nr:transcription factor steA-like [Homarus americanus]KAG7162701.1 Transcription factor steA-like [Homarus americanus]
MLHCFVMVAATPPIGLFWLLVPLISTSYLLDYPPNTHSYTSGTSSKLSWRHYEFIYRGEVSVANSELTGLIKILRACALKGLEMSLNVINMPAQERRDSSPISPGSPVSHSHNPRPKKAPRLSTNNGESKGIDTNFASLLSPANSYGHAINKSSNNKSNDGFAQLMDSGCADLPEHNLDGDQTSNPTWDLSLSESKLRSCLEGLESVTAAQTLAQSVAHTVAQSIAIPRTLFTSTPSKVSSSKRDTGETITEGNRGSSRRKNHEPQENKRGKGLSSNILSSSNQENVKDGNIPKENIKCELDADGNVLTTTETNRCLDPSLIPMYDTAGDLGGAVSDLTNPLLASYAHMLSLGAEDRAFSPLIPTTVQEQQVPSPTNKESRSLTCQLCGATIKHIANFGHMKQHLNPRRFPCPWCSAAFGRKDNLKTHTRKHHPAEVEAQEAGVLPTGGGRADNDESLEDGKGLSGLNGLENDGGDGRDGGPDEGDRDDSSDHNEGLVIAEDTEEEDEEDEDSRSQGDDGQ